MKELYLRGLVWVRVGILMLPPVKTKSTVIWPYVLLSSAVTRSAIVACNPSVRPWKWSWPLTQTHQVQPCRCSSFITYSSDWKYPRGPAEVGLDAPPLQSRSCSTLASSVGCWGQWLLRKGEGWLSLEVYLEFRTKNRQVSHQTTITLPTKGRGQRNSASLHVIKIAAVETIYTIVCCIPSYLHNYIITYMIIVRVCMYGVPFVPKIANLWYL